MGSKKMGNLIQREIEGRKLREISRWQGYSNHIRTNKKTPGNFLQKYKIDRIPNTLNVLHRELPLDKRLKFNF